MRYDALDMKQLQLAGLMATGVALLSCETTQTTGMRNQEQKRMAAL